ncbi:MAG TPA: DUF2066 domain-containing protein [Woeseiaceae bacterium]|nr:DUF2066 domain-containing protein [Woeseiaceae bacterium]
MKFCSLALISLFATAALNAAEVTALYTAQVPYDAGQSNAREQAYADALKQVILRVSGSELLSDTDLYEALFPDPAAYVVQFQPGVEQTMFVSFDGNAIEKTLRDAGQTLWGGDRPVTLVWVAVDWGQGEREIIGAADAEVREGDARSLDRNRQLRERILEIAASRGLPVVFPLLDSEDLANLDYSDIWGGFDERVLAASRRYDVNSVLIGRVRADGNAQKRWTYHFGDERRNWSGDPEVIIAQLSELLAAQFAIGGDEPLRAVDVSIAGVTSVDNYGEVQKIMAGVNVIDSYAITEIAGDRVRYRVTAHGGAARLARALRYAGLVEQERIDLGGLEDDNLQPDTLEFFFSP